MLVDTQHRWLREVVAEARWLHLSPGGGERYGDLLVATLPLRVVPDLDAATVALWKLRTCLQEEWPYEVWHEVPRYAEVANLNGWNMTDHDGVVAEDSLFSWLHGLCGPVVEAQRTLNPPLNPWGEGPSTGDGEALADLAFLRPDALRRKLRDQWNDAEALFVDQGHATLVCWSTSA